MNKLSNILLLLLIISFFVQKEDCELELYLERNDSLFFSRIIPGMEREINLTYLSSLGVYELNQKGKFIILNRYEENYKTTLSYYNGNEYKMPVNSAIDFQTSSVNKKHVLAIDIENYQSEYFLYDKIDHTFNLLKKDSLNQKAIYVFRPVICPADPSAKQWEFDLIVYNLLKHDSASVEVLKQSLVPKTDDEWEFLPSYSYWVNEITISYLLFKVEETEVNINLYFYNVESDIKSLFKTFSIPNNKIDLEIKYLIDGDKIFITDGKAIYLIKNNVCQKILALDDFKIKAFHL